MNIMKVVIVSSRPPSSSVFLCEMGVNMLCVATAFVCVVHSASVLFMKNVRTVRTNMFCDGLDVKSRIEATMFDCMTNALTSENLKVTTVSRTAYVPSALCPLMITVERSRVVVSS